MGMMAYLADTCEIRDRANVFVRGEAVILCAFAIGPFTGGLLTRVLPGGVYDVLWIALAGEVFSLLYYVCILPESHHSSRRAVKIANFWTTTQKTLKLIFLVPGKELLLLIAATAVISASFSGRSHFFLYAAYRLGWDSYDEGQFMLFSSLARTFYMIVVFPLIARAFAKARSTTTGRAKFEIWVARVCFAVYALSSVATGITTSVILLYMIAAIDSFGILASPTIRSLISSAVPAKMNAQLFSTVSLCEQLVGIVSSLLWPFIWTQSIDALPALFLFCCALLYIAGLCLMFFVHKAPEAIVMEDLESLVD